LVDPNMTTARPGRLTHDCHIVETDNESCRFRHSKPHGQDPHQVARAGRLKSQKVSTDTI